MPEGSPADTSLHVEDVLPSFEMHNYMFNRSIHDLTSPQQQQQPPDYLESSSSPNRNNLNESPIDITILNESNTMDPSTLLLNNISKLQRVSLPINIQIVITSNPPKFNHISERANPLKEYKPGETVYGYIIIENRSNTPIPFEMFLVSLEGEETVFNEDKSGLNTKLVSTFLKSYDLSACYHDGNINANVSRDITEALQKDIDDTNFGFNPDKLIFPKMKHKKFFMFKIPNYLLDSTCPHQLPQHLTTPPSFGCDIRACGGKADLIEINPLLGYGRLDSYGSPLKVNDLALKGQSISYFLHVQIIGKNEENVYSPFVINQKFNNDEVLVIKDSRYYIRVDTSLDKPLYEEDNFNQFSPTPTLEQIRYVQHLVEDELNSLIERKNLLGLGISDRREQDEIINRNLSTTKKNSSVVNLDSLLVPIVSDQRSPTSQDNYYSHELKVKFSKDLFNKVDGEMIMNFSMENEAQMNAITPKSLSVISQRDLNDTTPKLTPTNSSNSLKPISSFTAIKSQDVGEINISLEFKPRKSTSSLPTSINLTPNLLVYTIQSNTDIPITFDNHYMYKNGLSNLNNLSKKFQLYKNQLITTSKDVNIGLQTQILNITTSLADLKGSTTTVKKLFTQENIQINWTQNVMTGNYESHMRLKINIDDKATHRSQNQLLGIVPSFQTCHLGRGYLIELEITYKKGKPKEVIHFPIIID